MLRAFSRAGGVTMIPNCGLRWWEAESRKSCCISSVWCYGHPTDGIDLEQTHTCFERVLNPEEIWQKENGTALGRPLLALR